MAAAVYNTDKAVAERRERADVLLSYLTGLGPVGAPVTCTAKWLWQDMQWDSRTYYNTLNNLVSAGKVARLQGHYEGQYIVLKPLERGRKAVGAEVFREAAE